MSDSENEIDDKSHSQLVNAIKKFDKTQHIEAPSRNEAALVTSEFTLVKKDRANINDILSVIQKTKDRKLTSKIKKVNDASKVIPAPLEKPKLERIKRSTAFDESKEKLSRWDAIVTANRTTEHVSFPLQKSVQKLEATKTFLSKLKSKSDLERELDALDPEPPQMEEEDDEKVKYKMTLEEMKEHRSLLARIRARESFKAAKFKRQGKIKSKGYHRILRKERLKQQVKEFEELQKTDPEEALRRLNEMEQVRAKERHTLRHKNTGKWAKNLQVRAKYDKEARQQLAEQLQISKNLTQKVAKSDESDISEDEQIDAALLVPDSSNPWVLTSASNGVSSLQNKLIPDAIFNKESSSEEDEENIVEPVRVSNIQTNVVENKRKRKRSCKPQSTNSNWTVEEIETENENLADILDKFEMLERDINEKVTSKTDQLRESIKKLHKSSKKVSNGENIEKEFSLEFKNKKLKPQIDAPLHETSGNAVEPVEKPKSKQNITKLLEESKSSTDQNIDPAKFISVTPKYLATSLTNGGHDLDDLDDNDDSTKKVDISEVFEEDDVVAHFRKEKLEEINEGKQKEVDLSLPGWGSWGGSGIKPTKKKVKRFITKIPVEPKRRDENKGDVIIKEFNNKKLLAHKVKDLPFPFTSLRDFEASIRAPLGNTFIPEKAHKKAIKPSVFTKAGTIIEPMNEEDIIIKKKRYIS